MKSETIPIIMMIWASLAIMFGIYDLQISHALVDDTAQWASFLHVYGEIPGYALAAISFITLIISASTRNKSSAWNRLFIFSAVSFLFFIIYPIAAVHVIKFLVKRVRYRNLASDFSNYTPWFLSPISPSFNNAYASFPSGHAAAAFSLLPITILFKNKAGKYLSGSLVIAWGAAVSLSRIVVGAHYASDVLFSACMGFMIFILLTNAISVDEKWASLDECPCWGTDFCWCDLGSDL
jgi:membrane-associated phospholipid phosphatase